MEAADDHHDRLGPGKERIASERRRSAICVVLLMTEPLLAITLVPLGFLSFVFTLVFGFLLHAPHFPKWGMLVFSVSVMLLYWLFLSFMSLFMRLPSYRNHHY
jgi:hypothetical protein